MSHPPGPPMTLGNMRELGVQRLIASCLNDACRHQALIDVWSYPAETEITYFRSRMVCAKCGSRGNKIAAKLERATDAAEPDRQGVDMTRRTRRQRLAILLDAAFAVAIAATIVTVAHLIAWAMGW